MPAVGTGGIDIRNIIASILNLVKSRANQVCAATCDGLVLRMHYRWTFFFLLGGFFSVWYAWYHREVITCVSNFNAETQVRLDYINICLSYPFVEEGKDKRYLLFYRWISWSLLVLAGVYYIPRKVSKNFDNARCKKLLEDLAANAHRYDQAERELVERAASYILFNIKTHNGLYWKYLSVNVLALVVDIFAMQYLDFILGGRFIRYGFNAYPFIRDTQNFTDYMSQTFPPFASCQLTKHTKLTSGRDETLGCHLTFMELYEKLFLVLWLWLIVLSFVTCCYLVFLCVMWLPFVQAYLLRSAKPARANDNVRDMVTKVVMNCKIGDIYLLYRIKSHLSHARFYELMMRLSDPNLFSKQIMGGPPTLIPDTKGNMPPGKQQPQALQQQQQMHQQQLRQQQMQQQQQMHQQQLRQQQMQQQQEMLRNRKPNLAQDPAVNPNYLQRLLDNPEMTSRIPQQPSQQNSLKKNTSILIG